MKKFLLLASLIICNYSCKEVKEKLLPAFTINIPTIKLSVPPIPFVPGKEIPVGTLRTPINIDSTIKVNTAGTLGAGAIHIVKVKKITIKVLNPTLENNLSNFESARMVIGSDSATAEIAAISFPETSTDSLTVTPTNSTDIHGFLKGSFLNYNLYWKNRRPTTKFLKLDVAITLSVQ